MSNLQWAHGEATRRQELSLKVFDITWADWEEKLGLTNYGGFLLSHSFVKNIQAAVDKHEAIFRSIRQKSVFGPASASDDDELLSGPPAFAAVTITPTVSLHHMHIRSLSLSSLSSPQP